jgi:hypothetical protein
MMRGRYSSLQAKGEAVLTPLGVPCPGRYAAPTRTGRAGTRSPPSSRTLRRLSDVFAAFCERRRAGEKKPGYPRFKPYSRFDQVRFVAGDGAKWVPAGDDGWARAQFQAVGAVKVRPHRDVRGTMKALQLKREHRRWYVIVHPPPPGHRDLPPLRTARRGRQRGQEHLRQGRAGLWSGCRGSLRSCRLQAAEQSLTRIAVDSPAQVAAWVAAYQGRKVIVGVRPEDLAVSSGPGLVADVRLVEVLGSEQDVYFSIDATPAGGTASGAEGESAGAGILAASAPNGVARLDPGSGVRPGGRVTFAVDPARLYFFDPDTGNAITG